MFVYVAFIYFQVNASDLGEIKVYRGKKNYRDVGRVLTVDGETGSIEFVMFIMEFEIQFDFLKYSVIETDVWDEDECNQFKVVVNEWNHIFSLQSQNFSTTMMWHKDLHLWTGQNFALHGWKKSILCHELT